MFKKAIFFILILISFQMESQNSVEDEEIADNSISTQLYTKCFENLNQGNAFFKKYTNFKRADVCSLIYCTFLLSFPEKEAQEAGKDLLIEITTKLYDEGNPVYLIMGMDSYLTAKYKNENLLDDDHIVYISYGECTNPNYLIEAAKIVNEQTKLLIKRKK